MTQTANKLNRLIHGNGGTCPHCGKHTQPIKKNLRLFCSECHIHLWEKVDKTVNHNTSLLKKITVSIFKGLLLAMCWFPIWLIMSYYSINVFVFQNEFELLLLIVIAIAAIFFIEKFVVYMKGETTHYQSGVDFLADFEQDSDIAYKTVRGYRVPSCTQCSSERMADLYHYKKDFINEKATSIPKITVDEEDFVGCLHCKAGYELVKPKTDHTKMIVFIVVLVFGGALFLIYQEIIKVYIADTGVKDAIGLFMAGWFYGLLVSLPRKTSKVPFMRLKNLS